MLSSSETIAPAAALDSGPALLEVAGVSKRFGGVTALEDVSLDLRAGEILGLLGANGSGKSTLSRIIAGEMRADSGAVRIDGRSFARPSPKEAAALGVVMAHQHPSLAPHFPVWESIFLGAEICATGGFVSRRGARQRAGEVLQALGAKIDRDALSGDLTAAGQQWVEIARATSRRPRVLILDEPTAALTGAEVATLFASVRKLTETGVSVIFISHRLQEVEQLCNRIVVLRNGRNVGSWSTSGKLDVPRILELMAGDREAPATQTRSRTLGEPVLTLTNLRSGAAVRDVSLELRRGEVLGVAGLQGQGQEELLEAIAGLRPLDGGAMRLHGADLRPRQPRDMIDRGVCLVPNDRHRQGLFLDSSVGENLSYVAVSLDKRPWRLPARGLREFVLQTIQRLGVKTRGPEQPIGSLSGGNQQKVVIGKWLAAPIEALLLSDPTKGVDIHARTEIYQLVQELVAAGRAAIVFASDVHELLLYCDRIVVMYEGRITADLTGEAMTERRITAASFGRAEAEATP
jgi:ABC-type sugar transport system ATPase subunit